MQEKSSFGSDKIIVLRHSIIKSQMKTADSNAHGSMAKTARLETAGGLDSE
jgi:hypothetical protein